MFLHSSMSKEVKRQEEKDVLSWNLYTEIIILIGTCIELTAVIPNLSSCTTASSTSSPKSFQVTFELCVSGTEAETLVLMPLKLMMNDHLVLQKETYPPLLEVGFHLSDPTADKEPHPIPHHLLKPPLPGVLTQEFQLPTTCCSPPPSKPPSCLWATNPQALQ